MALITPANSTYMGILGLYFVAWLLALAGLSAVQHSCDDNGGRFLGFQGMDTLADTRGEHCSKLFRFPWLVLMLGTLPLLAELLVLLRPKRAGGSTIGHGAPLFAVIAVLYILMANLFYNLTDVGGVFGNMTNQGINGTIKRRLKVTLSGFAIAAAFALLAMLLAPMVGAKHHDTHESFTTTQSEKRGAVVYPPTTTTGAIVTGQETHTQLPHHGTTAPQVVVA